jgi:exoribonuclease-2
LEQFLAHQHKIDPLRFPDLSLVIVKLMGRGEYVVETHSQNPVGHFGLAVKDYTHSTAPNRRYPDIITLRQVKAILAHEPAPYGLAELETLAQHCTAQEDAAQKVERRMRKSDAALLLSERVGQYFDALVTGLNVKGSWVRLIDPPAEGRLVGSLPALRVGQKIRVKLISTDVERGYIDFVATHSPSSDHG